ncbi:MAG: DUF1931 family protein [Nanoarchaeota archaeon]
MVENMGIVIKSNIRKVIMELDKENSISSVAEEVGLALDKKVEDILVNAIERAKANKRRTIQARDL